MKRYLIIIMILMLPISVGCGNSTGSGGQDKIGIRGQIEQVTAGSDNEVSSILVKGQLQSDTQVDYASISIDKNTKITRSGSAEKVKSQELKKDMTVEVVFDGPVAESYPVQARAKSIKILE